jgi:hypothetical protein
LFPEAHPERFTISWMTELMSGLVYVELDVQLPMPFQFTDAIVRTRLVKSEQLAICVALFAASPWI